MVKVCHMTSVHAPEDTRIFQKECTSLATAGYDVYLVERGDSYEKNGVHVVGVGEVPQGRLKRMMRGARAVYEKALSIDADIYHFHDPELIPYGLKLKHRGKKVLFDSHENYPTQIKGKEYIPAPLRKAVSKMYAAYESYVCKRIDAVIYPSTVCGKNIFEGRAKRSLKIENYSKEVPSFSPAEVKKRQVIYAGTLSESRGITQLARAIMKTDGELLLCGPFVTESYREETMKSFPPSKVKYLGILGREELFERYSTCMAGASVLLPVGQYPNYDNLSTKTYECMQCGIPVVVSNFRYSREVNDRWHFGICVDPENVDEIADAIQYIFDHPDEAREMGENGRRAVEEEFNWEHEEKKLLALYEEILST